MSPSCKWLFDYKWTGRMRCGCALFELHQRRELPKLTDPRNICSKGLPKASCQATCCKLLCLSVTVCGGQPPSSVCPSCVYTGLSACTEDLHNNKLPCASKRQGFLQWLWEPAVLEVGMPNAWIRPAQKHVARLLVCFALAPCQLICSMNEGAFLLLHWWLDLPRVP